MQDTAPQTTPTPTAAALAVAETPETRKHHPYSPSKLNYLDDCAGFTSGEGTNEAAEQGTFLHGLMEQMVTQVLKGRAKTTLEQVAGWVSLSHELADDELDYLRFCCKRTDVFLARKPDSVHLEIKVATNHPDGSMLNSGYLDILFIFGATGVIQDYKFGWEPVRPAKDNLQGLNYAVGCFQQFRQLDRIGIEFVQPKLNWVTSHMVTRLEIAALFDRLGQVIERAEFVKRNPQDAQRYMKPGHYCKYCAKAGACTVLNNYRATAASKYEMLPLPASFKGLELRTPEDFALARYWVEVVESGLDELKAKAFDAAEANGGQLRCTLPNGKEIVYEVAERGVNRSLGSAVEIAEALKEFCSPNEILGAAELAIGKLEPIAKNALVELAKLRGEKLTKKAAWEQVSATLEAQGLLSRPDTKIRFLKLKKEANKQIEKV